MALTLTGAQKAKLYGFQPEAAWKDFQDEYPQLIPLINRSTTPFFDKIEHYATKIPQVVADLLKARGVDKQQWIIKNTVDRELKHSEVRQMKYKILKESYSTPPASTRESSNDSYYHSSSSTPSSTQH